MAPSTGREGPGCRDEGERPWAGSNDTPTERRRGGGGEVCKGCFSAAAITERVISAAPEASLPTGLSWEECKRRCPPGVVPACHNSKDTVTISGPQVGAGARPVLKSLPSSGRALPGPGHPSPAPLLPRPPCPSSWSSCDRKVCSPRRCGRAAWPSTPTSWRASPPRCCGSSRRWAGHPRGCPGPGRAGVAEHLALTSSLCAGDPGPAAPLRTLAQHLHPRGPVAGQPGPHAVRRVQRQQPGEPGAVPGGAVARAGERRGAGDRPPRAAAGTPGGSTGSGGGPGSGCTQGSGQAQPDCPRRPC